MADELTQEEFERIYGRAAPLTLSQVRDLFEGSGVRWWVCGGWSLELDETDPPRRRHGDVEVGVPREELPRIREWLSDYHLWDVHSGTLRWLGPEDSIADDHEQLWLRRDAASPWLMDLMLTPVEADTWFYKRDRRISRPLADALWTGRDGISRQRPEIGLLFKARYRRPRDEEDFAAVVPRLTADDRQWLRAAIALTESADNPWLERLSQADHRSHLA